MRVAIVVFVVMGFGLWLMTKDHGLPPSSLGEGWGRNPPSPSAEGRGRNPPSPLGEGRGEGRNPLGEVRPEGKSTVTLSPTLPQGGRSKSSVSRAEEGKSTAILSPTLPQGGGSKSHAEAVESVIGSKEFQETVTPLARLYLATFGRYPDYEGLNYYTGQREEARPLHEIADEFTGSREFELRYGQLDNAQFVELIFKNVLGHSSQTDVRNYWVGEIEAGRMTRGQVLVDLAESGAFRERSAAQVFVSTAYTEILHRTPDPAGYNYWVAQLQAGQPPSTVINGLLGGR